MGRKRRDIRINVVWKEEKQVLTLEGEPVLEYRVSRPEVEGGGLGGHWITRYYRRLGETWEKRWRQQAYWEACLELVRCRQRGTPFVPWKGEMGGEVTFLKDGLLSLRMVGEETRADGKISIVRWGDTWKIKEGAPCLPRELPGIGKDWKREARRSILEQGSVRQKAGDFVPDNGWESRIRGKLPLSALCVTEEGVELSYPQSVLAPAAEGTPTFLLRHCGGKKVESEIEIPGKN